MIQKNIWADALEFIILFCSAGLGLGLAGSIFAVLWASSVAIITKIGRWADRE